jgi:tRNA A-37 threonylcarbamoyl transferase component Bud32
MENRTEKNLGTLRLEHNNKKIFEKDGVITKVFDAKFYSASDVMKEAMNQAYALELGFNAPKVFDVFQVGGNWAIASEKIEGRTLAELMGEHPENKKKYITLLVKEQLHVLSHLSDNLKLPKLKDKLNNYISHSGLDATTRYDLHVRLEKMPNHYKVCHGDLDPRNLIVREDGSVFILDWAHATRGNASADAAMTYLLFVLEGDEKGAMEYLREFCRKADIALQYVQEWISVVSSTKLATTTDEAKRKILLANINVVEY